MGRRSAGSVPRQSRRAGAPSRKQKTSFGRTVLPQALVVAALVGGTTAFVSYDKTVTLVVDGEQRTVHTFATDVSGLLAKQSISTGEHDIIAPGKKAKLEDGDKVAVRYGRQLMLTVDGRPQQVWVTATSVAEALEQVGVRGDGAYLSASRDLPIGRQGLGLDIRTERGITFLVDGKQVPVRTNVATLQEAADQAGVVLGPQDRISAPLDSYPTEGQTVEILRITGSTVVKDEKIPFETEKEEDPDEYKGTEKVVTRGVPGIRKVTWAFETVNGVKKDPRKVSEEIVKQPVKQVVKVGAKALPNSVAGADNLNWGALAQCEAGGRAGAVDPSGTYHGLYQFDAGTWRSMGGTGVASQASASEQTYRAKLMFVQRGASPWPHCGRRLYS